MKRLLAVLPQRATAMSSKKIISILALVFVFLALVSASVHGSGDKDIYPLIEGKRLGLALTGDPATLHKVLIGFTSLPGATEKALVHGAGGTVKYTYHLVPAIAATVPEAAIKGLLRNPRVTYIEQDGVVHAIDAELDNAWGVKHIGAGDVHGGGNRGTGVKVAVIDTGIDYTHPDLDANYARGYDWVNSDDDPMDDNGHGTHVAGTVAAEDNDVGVVGVAPEATVYALKVLDNSGSGSYSDVIAALQWAVDNKIQVTNNSYGSSVDPGSTVKAAFDNAYATGVLNVCAAGNSGNPPGNGDNVIYPAKYESCIAVAATDSNDNRARFSSTGPDVELAAPGVSIKSTLPDGGYGVKSGTSMACPHVAGTAALVIAAGITDANENSRINDEVRAWLDETANDLGDPGRDTKYGYGLVDANEAADLDTQNDPPLVSINSPADSSTFDSGATIGFSGTANDIEDEDLSSSLGWISSIEGDIGTGGSFSATLSDGNHTITASVTDSGGKTGSDSIRITVGTPNEATNVSVNSITYTTEGGKYNDKHLLITVALVDDLGNPVGGASVSIKLDNSTGESWTSTGTTGEDGEVTFTLKNAPSACYITTVTNVFATELEWDSTVIPKVMPSDPFCK